MRAPDFTFTLPFSTRSKKNRKQPRRQGGMRLDDKDRDQHHAIRSLLVEKLHRLPGTPLIPKDHNIVVEIVRLLGKTKGEDTMEVRVWDLGQRDGPRGWDIDVGNYAETILDAMEGLVMHDDVQVCHLTAYRKKNERLWAPRKRKI